jgi:chorismate-pyruvate lyase
MLRMGDGSSGTAGLRAREPEGALDDLAATVEGLTRRHFVHQDARPAQMGDLDLLAVDPPLRNLLFTDGTVTRTLEVQGLASVWVEVIAQERLALDADTASSLVIPASSEAIRRRVAIGLGASAPLIWAESHIAPDRLPAGFLDVLDGSPEGIGQSLREVRLESWREMLWFGLDSAPRWAEEAGTGEVLRRVYRVIALGRPAMLISECFAVERRGGIFGLAERGQSLRPRQTPRRSA